MDNFFEDLSFECANETNFENLLILSLKLWQRHTKSELKHEFEDLLNDTNNNRFILCRHNELYVAFIHISIRRDYVEGSHSFPTAFVEGIYVEDEYRKRGIGKKLIKIGESWAYSKGCTQIGSDIELDNKSIYNFHNRVGFKEVNRIICFLKDIKK